ncbi:MAG: hypothetical protein KGM15_01175, partial [Pseudomonadota bacterium]|nr:hypothetical protein [Pseudomonadota bacterium]
SRPPGRMADQDCLRAYAPSIHDLVILPPTSHTLMGSGKQDVQSIGRGTTKEAGDRAAVDRFASLAMTVVQRKRNLF